MPYPAPPVAHWPPVLHLRGGGYHAINSTVMNVRCALVAASFVLLSVAPLCTVAQQASSTDSAMKPSIEAAAAGVADRLLLDKQKRVIVFAFYNTDGSLSALGPKLADDFIAALSKDNNKLRVDQSSQLRKALSKAQMDPLVLTTQGLEDTAAYALSVDAYVEGTISGDVNSLTAVAKLKGRKYKDTPFGVSFPLPSDSETTLLLAKQVAPAPSPPYYEDAKGFTGPKCLSCPNADYTAQAISGKDQGVAIFDAIVTTDGRLTDIRVLKALPDGLTANCVRTAETWQLDPARGPEGRPLAVRTVIQFAFQLR